MKNYILLAIVVIMGALSHIGCAKIIMIDNGEERKGQVFVKVLKRVVDMKYEKKRYKNDIKERKNLSAAYNNLGLIYTKEGKFEKAEAKLQTAIKLDPNCDISHNAWAEAYSRQGKLAHAESE